MTMALSRTMLMVISIFGIALIGCNSEKLHPEFYVETCPEALPTILKEVKLAVAQERRMGASLLRLFFHDCFVRGCDGSVLLDDTFTMLGEKNAAPNRNSLRGFDVVDNIKAAVERVCPGVVSCADILAIAARDSVAELGGPRWGVKLGRRDSLTASQAAANASIPPPTLNLTGLVNSFQSHGLSTQDMIALSGSHTIGQTKCSSFRAHIYNDTNIDRNFAATRQAGCPKRQGMGDNLIAPLDLQTPTKFDNSYFKNLMEKKGILHSDQELYNKNMADPLVRVYAYDQEAFFTQFAEAMIKMGDIKPLTGHEGQVRRHCRRKNVNGV